MQQLIDTRISQNNEHNAKLLSMQKQSTTEKDEIRRNYEEKLDELRGKMEQIVMMSSNSTKKGQEGEDWTYNELLRLFPEAMVEDTHAQGGRGDFIIRDKYVGMVDSKSSRVMFQNVILRSLRQIWKTTAIINMEYSVLLIMG